MRIPDFLQVLTFLVPPEYGTLMASFRCPGLSGAETVSGLPFEQTYLLPLHGYSISLIFEF